MSIENRRFSRARVSDGTMVVSLCGVRLGTVEEVSAGGMKIKVDDQRELSSIRVGRRIRVSVVDILSSAVTNVSVEILYVLGNRVGMKFLINQF